MTHRIPALALALATAALVPAVAAAQPSAPPAPAPAPSGAPGAGAAQETAPPEDVSTLNGQLVPVGDHNQYRHSFKRWNVSANPIGWIIGLYGASVSYGVGQNLALRADVNYFNEVGDEGLDSSGFEVGLGAPIYFRRTYQGVFLEPGAIIRRESAEFDGETISKTIGGPQMLVGWHWMWDSGLNVAVAVGAGRNWSSGKDEEGEIFGNGYLRFGYAF